MFSIASGCVMQRTSMKFCRSLGCVANWRPRKSASVNFSACTIVPMAPSSTRMRCASSSSSTLPTFDAAGFDILNSQIVLRTACRCLHAPTKAFVVSPFYPDTKVPAVVIRLKVVTTVTDKSDSAIFCAAGIEMRRHFAAVKHRIRPTEKHMTNQPDIVQPRVRRSAAAEMLRPYWPNSARAC